jgi:hypothetical protein
MVAELLIVSKYKVNGKKNVVGGSGSDAKRSRGSATEGMAREN